MDLKFVLQRVPGVTRRFVYYLESQGYIQPKRIQKERIARRDYGEGDLKVIADTWRYYSRGFSLQAAYGLAVKNQPTMAYAAFEVPVKHRQAVLDRLNQMPEVTEAGVVFATTADFIIKCSAPQEADIYQSQVPLFAEIGVIGVPGLMKVVDSYSPPRKQTRKGKAAMMAYVLMKVPSKNAHDVMDTLKKYPEVAEVCTVYGDSDLVVRVEVASQDQMDDLIMGRIHSMPGVESTRTYLVVGNMFWARNGE